MKQRSAKLFYAHSPWDEPAWIEVVSAEYQALIEGYDFTAALADLPGPRLLDIGCGTAIFPSLLDPQLDASIRLHADLLDVSATSLRRANNVLDGLRHFTPKRVLKLSIEQLPDRLPISEFQYDLIWAIHSFTTVELDRMPAVYQHMLRLLRPGGRCLVYQLAADSSYQRLHGYYRQHHPQQAPFMTSEDSERILRSLGVVFQLQPIEAEHRIPVEQPALLDSYLRKCVLDDSVPALDFFAPLLPTYQQRSHFRFPQTVNLISFSRSTA